jgi:hypothetical protein
VESEPQMAKGSGVDTMMSMERQTSTSKSHNTLDSVATAGAGPDTGADEDVHNDLPGSPTLQEAATLPQQRAPAQESLWDDSSPLRGKLHGIRHHCEPLAVSYEGLPWEDLRIDMDAHKKHANAVPA